MLGFVCGLTGQPKAGYVSQSYFRLENECSLLFETKHFIVSLSLKLLVHIIVLFDRQQPRFNKQYVPVLKARDTKIDWSMF